MAKNFKVHYSLLPSKEPTCTVDIGDRGATDNHWVKNLIGTGCLNILFDFCRAICRKFYKRFLPEDNIKGTDIELNDVRNQLHIREHELSDLKNQNEQLVANNQALIEEIMRLQSQNKTLEKAKQEALSRLSQALSVKLMDNNPHIANLGDRYRPTKLAEMFSELYDNEWTNVFSHMEGLEVTERRIIFFLLSIVMEAYTFSGAWLEKSWEHVREWYLDQNLPQCQETSKALKDGRKIKAEKCFEKVLQEFKHLLVIKANGTPSDILSTEVMQSYLRACVKLSLLMNASDPPVVMFCPEWTSLQTRDTASTVVPDGNTGAEALTTLGLSGHTTGAIEIEINEDLTALDQNVRKQPFNKDIFKDFTTKGEYFHFVVWPALYLHQGGPLLGKGVAQGINKGTLAEP